MIEKTAEFLLEVPPMDELTDDLAHIVEKFRYKAINKKQAMNLLLTECKAQVEKVHTTNELLNFEVALSSS